MFEPGRDNKNKCLPSQTSLIPSRETAEEFEVFAAERGTTVLKMLLTGQASAVEWRHCPCKCTRGEAEHAWAAKVGGSGADLCRLVLRLGHRVGKNCCLYEHSTSFLANNKLSPHFAQLAQGSACKTTAPPWHPTMCRQVSSKCGPEICQCLLHPFQDMTEIWVIQQSLQHLQ